MEAADGRGGRSVSLDALAGPITTNSIEPDSGPVLVTVEYHIDPKNRESFLHAVARSARERRRTALMTGDIEDPAQEGVSSKLSDGFLARSPSAAPARDEGRSHRGTGRSTLSGRRRAEDNSSDRCAAAAVMR